MNEYDLDAAYENLLRSERRKAPFYVEHIEKERQEIIDAFSDHSLTVHLADDAFTLETLLNPPIDEEADSDRQLALEELLLKDIDAYEVLQGGEVQVSGEGIFMYDSEEFETTTEVLSDGETIHGELYSFAVLPAFLSPEAFSAMQQTGQEPDSVDGRLSVWAVLDHAVIYDGAGSEIHSTERILVPFSYPDLKFGKVIRRSFGMDAHETTYETLTDSEIETVQELLTGDRFQQLCNDIENDLNYNLYDANELQMLRREYQGRLNEQIAAVSPDLLLRLSGDAQIVGDDSLFLFDQEAQYSAPSIIKYPDSWRVVHTFNLVDPQGDTYAFAHIFPEAIHEIVLKEQE